jgi:hypothetical protein
VKVCDERGQWGQVGAKPGDGDTVAAGVRGGGGVGEGCGGQGCQRQAEERGQAEEFPLWLWQSRGRLYTRLQLYQAQVLHAPAACLHPLIDTTAAACFCIMLHPLLHSPLPLQLTPATHITATNCEQCYLPQHTLPVPTAFGPVDVHISLAGSRVCKIAPDWQQCETVAAAAAAGTAGAGKGATAAAAPAAAGDGVLRSAGGAEGRVDARAVAAAAVQALRAGLEDGSVQLAVQNLF